MYKNVNILFYNLIILTATGTLSSKQIILVGRLLQLSCCFKHIVKWRGGKMKLEIGKMVGGIEE